MTLADLQFRSDEVRALYLVQLQQMHSAEHQMLDALPNLAVNILTAEVRERLLANATQTPDRLTLLDTIFAELSATPKGPVCEPMKALVDLSMELSLQHPLGRVRDMMLIALAKEIKHLGIAKYDMAATFAQSLGWADQVAALSHARQEETKVDSDLTFFAESVRLKPQTS